jgi:chromosome condensin MukBEF MukE localization factor
MATSDRTMFEIYREAGYGRAYRVVYFTELEEKNKEQEINRAMAGEHVFDGFLADHSKDAGKSRVAELVARLNAGDRLGADDIATQLREFLAG